MHKDYQNWVNEHNSRLALVILGCYFQELQDQCESSFVNDEDLPERSIAVLGVSYLMYLNRDIYKTYTLIERLVLIMPFLKMKRNN